MLSASDAGRIGRLVLPKKCAEVSIYFLESISISNSIYEFNTYMTVLQVQYLYFSILQATSRAENFITSVCSVINQLVTIYFQLAGLFSINFPA